MKAPTPGSSPPVPAPPEEAPRSGEGADTALKALIRKRKQTQLPDDPPDPPRSPAG